MPIIAVPWSEYSRDKEMRARWNRILDNKELLEKLPSDTWHGHKLQTILWSGKIKEDDEDKLITLWKEWGQ